MKTCFIALVLELLISLCGCSLPLSVLDSNETDTMKGWSFQYNESTNDYSVFFGLCTKSGKFISADMDVDIRIVNDRDQEVYTVTMSVSKDDFVNYTNKATGDQFLADVRIPAADIASGSSSNGTVYLKVYKENVVSFDEVNCSALFCLPVKDIQ